MELGKSRSTVDHLARVRGTEEFHSSHRANESSVPAGLVVTELFHPRTDLVLIREVEVGDEGEGSSLGECLNIVKDVPNARRGVL